MGRIKDLLKSFKYSKRILAVVDAVIVAAAGLVANFPLPLIADRIARPDQFVIFVVSVFCCFSFLMLSGAYNKLWRYIGIKDYIACVVGIVLGIGMTSIFVMMISGDLFWQFFLLHAFFAGFGVVLFRLMFKSAFITLVATGHKEAVMKRTLIVGAGSAAKILLQEILLNRGGIGHHPGNSINPVCLVDDDYRKLGKRVCGVMVVGATAQIPEIARKENIEQIIFAIPSCPPVDRNNILDLCSQTGLPLKILPFVGSFLDESEDQPKATGFVHQIRDIKVEDLLGRAPIKFNNMGVLSFIKDKVCMVTGGGGSIGSELVRQIAKYQPKQVVIVDIYENNAYEIQQELVMEYGDRLNLVTLIASVRDYFRMNQIFKKYKPDVVFHAAAHKHVPLMENNPMEAIKNNVIGTFHMATLALQYNVGKFVMISTDKAVNPTNVMGASKRCCEMIVQFMSQQQDAKTEFVTTRFGNVLGSNGSVIPLFKRQIEQGKPVTVTHPDIIRYFMTIPEAVSLVLEAASFAHGGEIFVLDMGQPVKIVTLAENLIRMYGKVPYRDVEIKFTGLRPGEKIKEELLMNEEGLEKTRNKLIFIGKQIEIGPSFINQLWKLKNAALENKDDVAIDALHEIVPTFTTPEAFNKKVMG
ncbi:MAG: polysaccharide biosynthesis protein [Fibrobacter sp.]|nr:polysaccharide biosynthesis protein [Fibrobacter sp.]